MSSWRTTRRRAGAERRPDRQLALARAGARQHQVRHVHAADEQHEADGAHQHQQHPAAAADDVVRVRRHRQRQLLRPLAHGRRVSLGDRFAREPSSPRACSTETPGFNRAMTVLLYMLPNARRSIGENAIGTKRAAGRPLFAEPRGGNSNRSGMMPTTVYG